MLALFLFFILALQCTDSRHYLICLIMLLFSFTSDASIMCFSSFTYYSYIVFLFFFFFQAEDGIRDLIVTGVQTCALPISRGVSVADKEAFLAKRSAFIARLRGVEPGRPFDPAARGRAIEQMERRQTELRKAGRNSLHADALQAAWVDLGPNPIPNGQTSPSSAVSGRVTAIEIHPTNP